MIIIKKLILPALAIIISGCIEPNEENIWSIDLIATYSTGGFCRNVSVSNNLAYVAAGQQGVQVWDLNTGIKLNEFFGYYNSSLYQEFEDIAIVQPEEINNLLFVNESNEAVLVFLFDDPNELTYRGTIMSLRTKDFISFPSVEENDRFYMMAADNDDGLKYHKYYPDTTINPITGTNILWEPIIDIGGETSTEGKPLGIDSDGISKVAMAVDQLGVELYSFDSLGSDLLLQSKYDLEGNAEQVKLTEEGVFVSCDDAGAYFLPISAYTGADVENSIIHFAEDLTVDHISVKNGIAVLSIGSKGVALYDISDPLNPEPRGIFDIGYVYRSQFWNNRLLLCTRSGLKVVIINS